MVSISLIELKQKTKGILLISPASASKRHRIGESELQNGNRESMLRKHHHRDDGDKGMRGFALGHIIGRCFGFF